MTAQFFHRLRICCVSILLSFAAFDVQAQSVDSPEIQFEQLAQDRVLKIMDKVDPYSIVQTRVILRKVETNLPGVWFDAKVTPKGAKGEVGKDGIAEIQVRIITQVTFVPEWVKSEVLAALKLGTAKINVSYEIGKGGLARAEDPLTKLPQIMDKFSKDLGMSMSNSFTTSMSNSLSTSLSKSLSESLPDAMSKSLSKSFSKEFSNSLSESMTKSLNASLPAAMTSALSAVQKTPTQDASIQASIQATQVKAGEAESSKGLENIKRGLWTLTGGILLAIVILAIAVFSIGNRIEEALVRVVDGRLAPLFQQGGGNRAAKSKVDIGKASFETKAGEGESANVGLPVAGVGAHELGELSLEVILNLFADCYWTASDGYANYLWSQMTQQQREDILKHPEFQLSFGMYLPFIRQFEPVNLGHHTDSRYLNAAPQIRNLNQPDLALWLLENSAYVSRMTPLRWETLPISLADRMRLTLRASSVDPSEIFELNAIRHRSAARVLPMRLVIQSLTADDELYVLKKSREIPEHMRSALQTLSWLALCPISYRKKVLDEFNARELADAWVGPDEVLAGLIEALPTKKVGMLKSYLSESQPSRDTEMFEILVASGLRGFSEMMATKGENESPSVRGAA